jgi:hypothetical protein
MKINLQRRKIFMANFLRITLFLVLLSLLPVSCSNPFNPSTGDYDFIPKDNDRENEEAELIALCLSGNISAPDTLYNRLLEDLTNIRSSYGDMFTQVNAIRFRAPWVPSCIIIGFEPGTSQLVANRQYNAWDKLNEQYQVTEIDLSSIKYDWVLLRFKGRLHPRRLSELYSKLSGVRYAEPNFIIGDSSNIYPRQTTISGLTYLFRNGWGDCFSGCISNEYWYFVAHELSETIFIGYWNPQQDSKEPDWWSEAKQNIEQYRKF